MTVGTYLVLAALVLLILCLQIVDAGGTSYGTADSAPVGASHRRRPANACSQVIGLPDRWPKSQRAIRLNRPPLLSSPTGRSGFRAASDRSVDQIIVPVEL